ncbi:MAG: hypothetical protein ACI4S2_12540 [Lachnospiraceae bacterium]
MAKEFLTDQQVEMEIERLTNSEAVKLARAEHRIKYKRRQYMYKLRNMEKRGKQLADMGYDLENIESCMLGDICEIADVH